MATISKIIESLSLYDKIMQRTEREDQDFYEYRYTFNMITLDFSCVYRRMNMSFTWTNRTVFFGLATIIRQLKHANVIIIPFTQNRPSKAQNSFPNI